MHKDTSKVRHERYVLITAVRDEAATIGTTIESVVGQTMLPAEWIIVSDGSTDQTEHLVAAAAATHDWIKLMSLPYRRERSFAGMVAAINAGLAAVTARDYEFLGLLDGDLRLPSVYFEAVLDSLAANPRLGIAGGMVVDVGEPRDRIPRNRLDVPGAVQMFRRSCFEAVRGYLPIPEGGFDAVACAHARMLGYETSLITTLIVDHLKPRNHAFGSVLKRKWQLGVRDYAIGYHPLFELVKCCARVTDSPLLLASTASWLGYCSRFLSRPARVVPHEVVAFIRREQLRRLWRQVVPVVC